MLNWDWLRNRPAEPSGPEELLARENGWYRRIRHLLRLPLLDTSLPDDQLAAGVDEHTMRVHVGLLDKLGSLRREESSGKYVLDDPYWQALQGVPYWDPSPPPDRRAPHAWQEGTSPPPVPYARAGGAAAAAPQAG